jgi:putative oxidoreductase
MQWLEKYADYIYAMLRIMAGVMFMFHGIQKVFGVLADFPLPAVGSQPWIAGVIETIGGTMILLGLGTRIAAFICSGEMAVAYFQIHWQFRLGTAFFPIVNKGELAILYCFIFLYISSRGGVKWCLDNLIKGKKKEPVETPTATT